MSLLGKLLVVLNAAVLGLLVFLFMLDYGQRQRWAYNLYRADLVITGLPLDDRELEPDGTPKVANLPKPVQKEIFPSEPVGTQVEEVDRVGRKLQTLFDDPEVPGTKEQKLARALLAVARTYGEREAMLRRWYAPTGKTEDLETELGRQFTEVRNAAKSIDDRKQAAARLLICLAEVFHEDEARRAGESAKPDPLASAAYMRAVTVVGLAAASRAVDEQALVLETMGDQVESILMAELDLFLGQHARLVYATQNLADDLRRQETFRDAKKDEADKQESEAKARALRVEELRQRLKEAQKKTDGRLTEQAKVEQMIFDRLKAARDAGRQNDALEKEVGKLEKQLDELLGPAEGQ
jgi:hypothetical protein